MVTNHIYMYEDEIEILDIIKLSPNISYINNRILKEICFDTINSLKVENLLDDFKKCKSIKNKIINLKNILNKYINEENIDDIIESYIIDLIPPGTKGVIRGLKFNHIVKQYIYNLNLSNSKFDINFEKYIETCKTDEKPDWYIIDKHSNKILIGMNQLDLWNGGHQLMRFNKYIIRDNYDNTNIKFLCVICNYIQIKSEKNKVYKLFETGFKNNTLCYIKNLKNIIYNFFEISK